MILKKILLYFSFILLILPTAFSQDSVEYYRPAHVGLIYPISTNGAQAARCSNGFSFHLLGGVSLDERAFILSGLYSVVKKDAKGVMLSGLFNNVGDSVTGLQLAGLLNITGKTNKGLQLAGLINKTNDVAGMQLAGLLNVAHEVSGLQLAGIANVNANSDAQIAGLANIAKNKSNVQVAGLVNKATAANFQVAGFMNVAKKVKGVQLAGLINIAEDSDYPIGIINLVKNGERQVGVSFDENGTLLASFVSGGRVLYGIIGVGYNFQNATAQYVAEGGAGIHIPVSRHFRINAEMVTSVMSDISSSCYFKSSAKILASYKIANRAELFAGPTFNQLGYDRSQSDIGPYGYLFTHTGNNNFMAYYIGATAGLRINL